MVLEAKKCVSYKISLLLMRLYRSYSGALAHEARSGAPWVRKCGKLPIQENLVIT